LKSIGPILLLAALAAPSFAAMKPSTLKCEYVVNAPCIDNQQPRLSWVLESDRRADRQSGYQVLVASTDANLKANRGDLWDSGRVAGSAQLNVLYAGKPLVSGQRCVWKIRAWDRDGQAGEWSAPALWEMGILGKADWKGRWIGRTTDTAYQPAPMLRKGFELKGKIRRARAYVCGLGYYELRLNGKKVGDHHLDPGYTRYDRRALYTAYDVTKDLKEGRNALGVILGTGWQNVHTIAVWYFDKAPWRAAPRLLMDLRIEYADGKTETISTGPDWKASTGPIVFDSIYAGESYDARLEKPGWDTAGYGDSAWEPAKVVDGPPGLLTAQQNPPIKIEQTLMPAKLSEPKPGVFLFDFGQNMAGHALLSLSAPAGTKVTLQYGERLNPDGTLDQKGIAEHQRDPSKRFQTDEFIAKGQVQESWEARFDYHGFQYVQVTGFPGRPTVDTLRARFVHSDVAPAGEFECSNPLLNKIQTATKWSYLSNLQGIPTDCPHREKNGWTGDAHLASEQGLYNFDSLPVYEKWLNDLNDEQRPTGELPGIVPSSGWGYEWGNGPAWDSAFLLIPWYLYVYCGDTKVLADHYDGMKRYVDYLASKSKDGINNMGLGDWVPWKTETPVEVTSTGYYYRDALVVSRAADILGKKEEADKYHELADSIRVAFNRKFIGPKTGNVANGSQTALSCALYQDLAFDEVKPLILQQLLTKVDSTGGHIDTGILGAKYILNALLDADRPDVAFRIASQKTQPGWGWWIENGATTLWESWQGTDSRCHIMFGDISAWFYRALAGIRPDGTAAAPGFAQFTIKPYLVGGLTHARGRYDSVRGRIVSDWTRTGDQLQLRVEIPANTTALVSVPSADGRVTEGGRPVAQSEGIKVLRQEKGYLVLEVGSGRYEFASTAGG